ncbi:MAG TPA: type I 3-dehydroquinate dehydratase [Pyrinomonadaceae bacterium]|nr:type I 3-dehydroquinate dehydratase [Pyrinomonadaceae bacterium]
MAEASLIATLSSPPSAKATELSALSQSVKWLEVRADLVGDLNPEWLRAHFRGQLLYTLRSRDEGGADASSLNRRQERLTAAARAYDRIELQAGTDLIPDLLDRIPVEKRLISWHGEAVGGSELQSRFAQLSSVPAAFYKLVSRTKRIADELTCLSFLKGLGRADTIAYAQGPLGFWSRVVALHLGAPAIFGPVTTVPGDPTEPAINKLIDDYQLPEIRPATQLFAIIGDPIFHSLSPRLHNSAYREQNYPALFVPLQVASFETFWQEFVVSRALDSLGLPLNGMTVASPHKEAARTKAKVVSGMARLADSSNILVRNNGWWNADTTDPEVVYLASQQRQLRLREKRAAVIGCGGAGRAIAAALVGSGAAVTLINRGAERGHYAARLLGLTYIPLAEFSAAGYDIVVNATPVGRDDHVAPFNLETLNDEVVIIDLVYGSSPTPLVESSLAREQVVIDGRDVLLTQVTRQFQMMTGNEMPLNGKRSVK